MVTVRSKPTIAAGSPSGGGRADLIEPQMTVDPGWDMGRRRQDGRRIACRDGLSGGGEAEDRGNEPGCGGGGKSDLLHCGVSSFFLCGVQAVAGWSRFER